MAVLRQVAERERLEIREVFIEAKSAKEPGTRPEFQRMLDAIRAGEIDGILTWHINRLSRNMVDGGTLAHMLYSGQIEHIRTPERLYRKEDNVLLLAIENGMATNFVHDLSKVVKRGMASKADKGWLPGRAPMGYINNPWTKEIDPDPERFGLIQLGWKLLLEESQPITQIHKRLIELGLTCPGRSAKGRPVSLSSLYSVFKNPFYAGVFRLKGEVHAGNHRSMVSWAEFEEAQETILNPRGKYRKDMHEHDFSGLFRCARCGSTIVPSRTTKRLRDGSVKCYTYYHCGSRKGCQKAGITESSLQQAVVTALSQVSIPEELAQWCSESLRQNFSSDARLTGESRASLQTDLARAKVRSERLMSLYLDGDVEKADFHEAQMTLKAQIQAIESKLRKTDTIHKQIQDWLDRKLRAAVQSGRYETLSFSARRAVLLAVGENHLLDGANATIEVDPVLRILTVFKPCFEGSQSRELAPSADMISIWQGKIDEIWNRAQEQVVRPVGSQSDPPEQDSCAMTQRLKIVVSNPEL